MRIFAFNQQGTLGAIRGISVLGDIKLLDEVDGLSLVIPEGFAVLQELAEITSDPQNILAFYSTNNLSDQIAFFSLLKKNIPRSCSVPHFSIMPVCDAKRFAGKTLAAPQIIYFDENFKESETKPDSPYTLVVGIESLSGSRKEDLRTALTIGAEIYAKNHPLLGSLLIDESFIFDDDEETCKAAKQRGWQANFISTQEVGAPKDSYSLLQGLEEIKYKKKIEAKDWEKRISVEDPYWEFYEQENIDEEFYKETQVNDTLETRSTPSIINESTHSTNSSNVNSTTSALIANSLTEEQNLFFNNTSSNISPIILTPNLTTNDHSDHSQVKSSPSEKEIYYKSLKLINAEIQRIKEDSRSCCFTFFTNKKLNLLSAALANAAKTGDLTKDKNIINALNYHRNCIRNLLSIGDTAALKNVKKEMDEFRVR